MSSMLSKNHIKYRDLQGYLFTYDRNTVESAEVWAKDRSTGFEPGMMVFCLEKVTPQSAVVVGRKDDGDSYKVSDLCFVVGEDDNRALGVNITSNVYDLRFIEALLCEKAQKAILNEKDFLYVTTKPANPLDQSKIHEIEQVGAVYAMGGSRRALVVDTNGPNEPAMALLSLMGANITPTGIGRQLLDIGNVCSLLFSSDSRQQDDQNKILIRSIYAPIASGQAIIDQTAVKAQAGAAWQGPTGGLSGASAPPAPTFNQSINAPPTFAGAPPTWGVPPKFEETKAIPSNNQSFVADIPASIKPAELSQPTPAMNYQPQANSPFQEIPQAPPMAFGGQFSPPAQAAPQSPAPAPEAPPMAPSMPDFSAPTEFEQHFNAQPYFEEQPQATQASEHELRQAYEQASQTPPAAEQPVTAPVEFTQQYTDASLESAWFAPSEAEKSASEPNINYSTPESTPSGFAPSPAEAPVVIPPRFPSSMYGSSTAAAISPQAPLEQPTQFGQNLNQSNSMEQFNTAEPISAPPQAPYIQQAQASTAQVAAGETASAENMALPSLEELGIQPLERPVAAPVPEVDQSAQWWSAQEMQKPLLDEQSVADPNDSPEASPAQLVWGSAPEPEISAPAAPENSAPVYPSFTAEQASAEQSAPVESAPYESFMHAQPIEPGNISQAPESVEALPQAPVPAVDEEIKNNPAMLWMAQDQIEEAVIQTPVESNLEKAPVLPETPAPTFFEQAAQALKPEIPQSPFALNQKQNTFVTPPAVASEVAGEEEAAPNSMEPSEDTLILSSVKDAQIQASKAAASAPRPKPQTVQDPKLVAKETALLMSKLEHQVGEAAKRLNSRSEAVKQRLNRQVEELLQAASDAEKNSQNQTTDLSLRLSTHITNLSEEIRQQLSETASGGRYTIKQLLSTNQSEVEGKQAALENELKTICQKFREDAENFAQEAQQTLQELVESKTAEIEALTEGVLEHLDDTNADFVKTFEGRFNRFKERIADEAASVKQSLERNVRSMFEEVEGSWERASEKLKDNQRDFEQRISHSVKSAKLISSENSKQMIATSIFPLVKERRLNLQKLIDELTKRFQQESNKQAEAQLNGLEASLTEARHQLQNLVSDCLESINAVGKQQQAGLEEVFKDTSVQAESGIAQVKTQLSEAHRQITETEALCRSLVESSNLDTEVELTEVRNTTAQSIKTAKQDANTKLQETIEEHSNNLDRLSNKVQNEINAERVKQTKAAREASEVGLSRLREAIQEAVAAVQAAREKHME